MDELNKPDEPIDEFEDEEEELGISDKIVGVFTEPGEIFSTLANLPVKTMDWLLPVLLLIVTIIAMQFVMFTNPTLKEAIQEKSMAQVEKSLQEAVDKGQLTQEQADQRLEQTAEFMERGGSMQIVFGAIGTFIFVFIFFFIVSGVFLLISKIALGGIGDYKVSMISYGMPHYIAVLNVIIMIIAALLFGKIFQDASIGSFMGIENEGIGGWLMHKLDPLSIWFYSVVGIAYAKMFKSDNTIKYVVTILGIWLGFSLIMHFVVQAFPFLKQFGM